MRVGASSTTYSLPLLLCISWQTSSFRLSIGESPLCRSIFNWAMLGLSLVIRMTTPSCERRMPGSGLCRWTIVFVWSDMWSRTFTELVREIALAVRVSWSTIFTSATRYMADWDVHRCEFIHALYLRVKYIGGASAAQIERNRWDSVV